MDAINLPLGWEKISSGINPNTYTSPPIGYFTLYIERNSTGLWDWWWRNPLLSSAISDHYRGTGTCHTAEEAARAAENSVEDFIIEFFPDPRFTRMETWVSSVLTALVSVEKLHSDVGEVLTHLRGVHKAGRSLLHQTNTTNTTKEG